MTHESHSQPQRPVRKLPKYLIPVVICLAGVVLICTIALAPLGIAVLLVGLIWAAIQYRADRPGKQSG